MDELEEVILALRAAGLAVPEFQILPDGSYYFYYGQENANLTIHLTKSGSEVDRH